MLNKQAEELKKRFITVEDVQNYLGHTDHRATEKWLTKNGIKILKGYGPKKVVYLFLVEIALDNEIKQMLMAQYPKEWRKYFQAYINDDRFHYSTLLEQKQVIQVRQSTKKKELLSPGRAFLDEIKT